MAYDVIVIGGGSAGESAGQNGAKLGGKVAVVERDLLGGECSFWACNPSKILLDSAARRNVNPQYPWEKASDRRDWMIMREGTGYPDDVNHVGWLQDVGGELIRGTARVVGKGKVEVRSNGRNPETFEAENLIVAIGAEPFIPPIKGLEEAGYWTSRDGASTRDLPSSLVVLGGGPVGLEMAQVFARFGSEVTVVEAMDRLAPGDHPKSSQALQEQLEREDVEIRTGVTAESVKRGGKGRVVGLSDGGTVEGAEVIVAVGRRGRSLEDLGLEEAGVTLDENGRVAHDEQMRVSDGVFLAGDVAGGLQFTHVAWYEGEVAVRAALGGDARVDLSAVPRTTFTDPETSAVGLTVEQAREKGIDAEEFSQDFAGSPRGIMLEDPRGYLTAVVDKERKVLVGAFAACHGASEVISEATLAVKHQIPIEVIADTIHPYPTASRVFGAAVEEAVKQLGS